MTAWEAAFALWLVIAWLFIGWAACKAPRDPDDQDGPSPDGSA